MIVRVKAGVIGAAVVGNPLPSLWQTPCKIDDQRKFTRLAFTKELTAVQDNKGTPASFSNEMFGYILMGRVQKFFLMVHLGHKRLGHYTSR